MTVEKHDDGTLLSTAYMPPIGYMAVMARNRVIHIEQQETFPKQTLRNRCLICTANGVMPLTVPVVRPNGNHTVTRDIAIDYKQNWNTVHWRTLVSAYSSSPYFLYYKDGIEAILMRHYDRLIELNRDLLDYFVAKLKLDNIIDHTEGYARKEHVANDLREVFPIKKECRLFSFTPYYQVFEYKQEFHPNLSILDLLFNLGPEAPQYLTSLKEVNAGTQA